MLLLRPAAKRLSVVLLLVYCAISAIGLPTQAAPGPDQPADAARIPTEDTDEDRDGLEDVLEVQLGTDPRASDTDGDGLSDYDEYCKYRTDPTKSDSDGDGVPDGNWEERREYTYTIQAICEIRAPSSLEMVADDLYQDARLCQDERVAEDAVAVELLLFPFATAHVVAQPYPESLREVRLTEYQEPTVSMDYSAEIRSQIEQLLEGCTTDLEAVDRILRWVRDETEVRVYNPHWEYLQVRDGVIRWHKSLGTEAEDRRFLETNFLGSFMFRNKVRGTCSSTAILNGMMLRAAGFPTRLIQTLPLMTRYTGDAEPLADRLRDRTMAKSYNWGPGPGGANHTYNEVFLNHRWVRVDSVVGTGPSVNGILFVKAWSAPSWNNLREQWNEKRCVRAIDVSDRYAKYHSRFERRDLAVRDNDLTLRPAGEDQYTVTADIRNAGNISFPEIRVRFYASGPNASRRRIGSDHSAGPIMPGGIWNEGTLPFVLQQGEDTVSVVIDADDSVKESDETNNEASRRLTQRHVESVPVAAAKPQGEPSSKIDLAVSEDDITVSQVDDGYLATAVIHNNGTEVVPQFHLVFRAGDIHQAGRKLHPGRQVAGPLEPGASCRPSTPALFTLHRSETRIYVFLDPDSALVESDEANNSASCAVPPIAAHTDGSQAK